LDTNIYTELETGYEGASKMLNGLIRALKHKEDGRKKGSRVKGQGVGRLNP